MAFNKNLTHTYYLIKWLISHFISACETLSFFVKCLIINFHIYNKKDPANKTKI